MPWLKRAELLEGTLLLVHGHRGGLMPTFSLADFLGEQRLFAGALGYFGDRPMGAMLVTPHNAIGRLWWPGQPEPTVVERIKVVGRRLQMFSRSSGNSQTDTHARQVLAIGAAGQRRLRSLRIAVVGAGGTGSLVIQFLAHLGVGRLLIIDPDRLARSNRSRVVGSTAADEGRHKVEIAAGLVARTDPSIEVTTLVGDVRDWDVAEQLRSADVIFGCTDSHSSRAILNRLALAYLVPLIDLGVGVALTGDGQLAGVAAEVRPVVPGGPCLWCHGALKTEQIEWENLTEAERGSRTAFGYGVGDVEQPSVITFNAIAAAHAVALLHDMASPFMAGPSADEALVWTAGSGRVTVAQRSRRDDCTVCGSEGIIAHGDGCSLGCRRSPNVVPGRAV